MGIRSRPSVQLPDRKRRRINIKEQPLAKPQQLKLLDLPDDALQHILGLLHPPARNLNRRSIKDSRDAFALAVTCKRFLSVARDMYRRSLREIDALRPIALDDHSACASDFRSQESLSFVPRLAGSTLRVVKLPLELREGLLTEVLSELPVHCPEVRELSFVDGGSVGEKLATSLSSLRKIRRVEIRGPGKAILRAMAEEFLGLQEVVLCGVSMQLFEAVKKFLRIRSWNCREKEDCQSLRELTVGLHLTSGECAGPVHLEERGALEEFLTYLKQFAKRDLHALEKFRIVDVSDNVILSAFLAQSKRKAGHGTSFFSEKTVVEFEHKDGRTTVIPAVADGIRGVRTRSFSLQLLMSRIRNGKAEECEKELAGADTFWLRSLTFTTRYAQCDENFRGECMEVIKRGGRKLKRLKVCFSINDCYHKLLRPKRVFRCMTDVLSNCPSITAVEVSSEIIEWTGTHLEEFMQLLRSWVNMRVVHLKAPRNLNRDVRAGSHERNARLVRRLPLFLELLEKHCPDLDCLYLEEALKGSLMSWDGRGVLKSLESALKATEKFEETLPFVDAGTIRTQLEAWICNI